MLKNQFDQIRSVWIISFALISMMIAQSLFTIPGMIVILLTNLTHEAGTFQVEITSDFQNQPWAQLLTHGGGAVGGILVTCLLWRFLNKKQINEIGIKGSFKDLGFGMVMGAISITIIFALLIFTGQISLINALSSPEFTIFTFTSFLLFIPVSIFEELFFRGYVMSTMKNRSNRKWAIYVASALIFSFAHGLNPNINSIGLINIILVGLLFAYMYDVTKSLLLPIGYHLTWNYFQGTVFGFSVSGTTSQGIYRVKEATDKTLLTGGSFGLEGGLLATLLILLGFVITYFYSNKRKSKEVCH